MSKTDKFRKEFVGFFLSGLSIKDVFADFYGSFEPTKTDINQNFIR